MAPAEPKPGDLIEIFRRGYAHWALYVGDGYVVHVGPPGDITGAALANIMSSGSERAIVKKELLSKVAGKDQYRVNNKHDRKYSPRPPSEIMQKAAEQVGKEMPYKLTTHNCEHFVNELRYGVHRSNQVTDVVYATVGTASIITFGMAVGIPAGVAAGVLGVCLTITGLSRAMQN